MLNCCLAWCPVTSNQLATVETLTDGMKLGVTISAMHSRWPGSILRERRSALIPCPVPVRVLVNERKLLTGWGVWTLG